MIGIAPLFLTFTAISIGLWASIRFSVFIPTNRDEKIFKSIVGRVSYPFGLSAVFFLLLGISALLLETPPNMQMTINIVFLVFFVYVCSLLLMGLNRLDKIWPGRRAPDFTQLLSYIKLEDYKRGMALKLYEAYLTSTTTENGERIAKYMANLIIA